MKGKEMYCAVIETSKYLKRVLGDIKPEYLIIMGSGLKNAMPNFPTIKSIPYTKIPNFKSTTVKGHVGELIYGKIDLKEVIVMRGRFHYYEGHPITYISFPIRLFHYMGVRKLIVTAAVGSLKKNIKPGDIILLKDHINLMNTNPLIGNYYEKFGEMFVDMSEVYRIDVNRKLARRFKNLKSGVYVGVSGPCYETVSEAKMYRIIGGDVMGMSVVGEVISAKQLGMDVVGICWVSNYVPGIDDKKISHDDVLKLGDKSGLKIKKMIEFILKEDIF